MVFPKIEKTNPNKKNTYQNQTHLNTHDFAPEMKNAPSLTSSLQTGHLTM